MINLDALERLAAEATPGAWRQEGGFLRTVIDKRGRPVCTCEKVERGIDDAAFIAACDPATVAALVRAVKALAGLSACLPGHPCHYCDLYAHSAACEVRAALAPFAAGAGEETGE